MRNKHAKTLASLLRTDHLASLETKTRSLARLNFILENYLERELRSLCKVGALEGNTLTLITPSSTAATRLRYLSRLYLQQLRQHEEMRHLERIRVKVIAGDETNCPPQRPVRQLSQAGVTALSEAAESLNDPELSPALRRLARHGGEQK